MKKTNKIIAIVLAMVLAFSSVPLMASAAAIKDDVNTAEKLIQGENLGNLVEWLLKNLNNRKEETLGSILRLVFTFVEDESLKTAIGSTDVMSASKEKLADILVAWLDKNLPTWTAELTNQSWWGIVTTLTPILGININLKTARGVVMTLSDLCGVANNNFLLNLGDLEKLSNKTIKGISNKSSSIDVVYALFSWLADDGTIHVLKQALKGELSLGRTVENVASGTSEDINNMIKENISPEAIKKMFCDAVNLSYDVYGSYTADQLFGVSFLKVLTGSTEIVTPAEADKVTGLSIYGFLEEYAGAIYKNLLVGPLNTDVKQLLVDKVKPLDDEYGNILDEVFNWDYNFTGNEFDAVLGAGKGNMVAQLNDAVITLLEKILTADAFQKLGLKRGGNENINENLTKTFRFLLPKLAKIDKNKLGADLSAFNEAKVKNMTAEEMAIEVLKLFFPGWFKNSNAAELASVKTLEQLAVLAAKYAATNAEWVPMQIKSAAKATKVNTLTDAACLDLIFEIGMETAAKALDYNKSTTYYELPADTSTWTGEAYLDDIVDWALNFVDGLPASADGLSTERGKLDGEGGFFKLNVVLDSLIDLSFITGCGNDYFAFDFETMLMDKFLGNLLNFDIKASVDMLAANEKASLFDKKINVAIIDLIDDLLTGLFEEGYKIPATYILGDADMNGKLESFDARAALRAAVGLDTVEPGTAKFKASDVDTSGKIESGDARKILRVVVGLESF